VVASRTGQNPAEAEARVTEVVNAAKAAADEARKFSAGLAGWLTLAMFVGAFAAAAAAMEGGQLRDGRWKGVIFAKNYRSTP
jgi:parvulin-like peptidyl-prolyl isomerase